MLLPQKRTRRVQSSSTLPSSWTYTAPLPHPLGPGKVCFFNEEKCLSLLAVNTVEGDMHLFIFHSRFITISFKIHTIHRPCHLAAVHTIKIPYLFYYRNYKGIVRVIHLVHPTCSPRSSLSPARVGFT